MGKAVVDVDGIIKANKRVVMNSWSKTIHSGRSDIGRPQRQRQRWAASFAPVINDETTICDTATDAIDRPALIGRQFTRR